MSQRDFLTCVANDAFLGQVDVFRDWTIKIMIKNAADNTVRGSYRPMRVIEFYFNAQQKGKGPTSFKETTAKPGAGCTQSLNISKPGPKSTKVSLPDFPEMLADDEAQKVARKSALIIAKLKDGTMRP